MLAHCATRHWVKGTEMSSAMEDMPPSLGTQAHHMFFFQLLGENVCSRQCVCLCCAGQYSVNDALVKQRVPSHSGVFKSKLGRGGFLQGPKVQKTRPTVGITQPPLCAHILVHMRVPTLVLIVELLRK